jgi:hypothetical protein
MPSLTTRCPAPGQPVTGARSGHPPHDRPGCPRQHRSSRQRAQRHRPSAGAARHPHHCPRGTVSRVQRPAHQPGAKRRQPVPAPRRARKRRAHHAQEGLRRQTRPHLDHHHESRPGRLRRGDRPAQAPDQPHRRRRPAAGAGLMQLSGCRSAVVHRRQVMASTLARRRSGAQATGESACGGAPQMTLSPAARTRSTGHLRFAR